MSNPISTLISQIEAQKSRLEECYGVINTANEERQAKIDVIETDYEKKVSATFDEVTDIRDDYEVVVSSIRIIGRSSGMSEAAIDAEINKLGVSDFIEEILPLKSRNRVKYGSYRTIANQVVDVMKPNRHYLVGELIDAYKKAGHITELVTIDRVRQLFNSPNFRQTLEEKGVTISRRGNYWEFSRKSQTKGTQMTNTLSHLISTANRPLTASEIMSQCIKERVATKDQRNSVNGALGSMVQSGVLTKQNVDGKNVYSVA